MAILWTEIPCWWNMWMVRLIQTVKWTIVAQMELDIRAFLNVHETLKQMCYSSRRPSWVSFMSNKNKKLRLQFAKDHKNWWRNLKNIVWSNEELDLEFESKFKSSLQLTFLLFLYMKFSKLQWIRNEYKKHINILSWRLK